MIENLVQQFLGSGAAGEAVSALQAQQGMSEDQAKGAVGATAEGAAQALAGGGGADLGSMLGGLAGGGGLGALAGAMTGGGAAGAGAISPQLIDTVAGVVAQKTGIEAGTAKTVVSLVLPKVLEFAKAQMGGGGAAGGGSGAGGLLGGLLG